MLLINEYYYRKRLNLNRRQHVGGFLCLLSLHKDWACMHFSCTYTFSSAIWTPNCILIIEISLISYDIFCTSCLQGAFPLTQSSPRVATKVKISWSITRAPPLYKPYRRWWTDLSKSTETYPEGENSRDHSNQLIKESNCSMNKTVHSMIFFCLVEWQDDILNNAALQFQLFGSSHREAEVANIPESNNLFFSG